MAQELTASQTPRPQFDEIAKEEVLPVLSYGSFRNEFRKRRYLSHLRPHHEPHSFALRASQGMKVQKMVRGMGSNARALWRALAGLVG